MDLSEAAMSVRDTFQQQNSQLLAVHLHGQQPVRVDRVVAERVLCLGAQGVQA